MYTLLGCIIRIHFGRIGLTFFLVSVNKDVKLLNGNLSLIVRLPLTTHAPFLPMTRDKIAQVAKLLAIVLGGASLIWAFSTFKTANLGLEFLLVLLFSTLVAPRMSLALHGSRFAISFSDAAVFLSFLLFGGPAAIIVAAAETCANCLYLRKRGFPFGRLMIPTNVSINAVATSVTFLVYLNVPRASFVTAAPGSMQLVIATLGALAVIQFAVSSALVAVFQALREGVSLWTVWRRDCFSSSVTQMVGAALAGLIYKLINYGDIVSGLIAFFALGIAYLSYRKSISEANRAITSMEAAERAKAETERERRIEAEGHAAQLAQALEKEERANDALRRSEQDLQFAALHDSLTGLPNRKRFNDILRRLIEAYKNDPLETFHVLFLDLARFKNINDSLGHALGDQVLRIAGKRFVRLLKQDDMVARIGGDEFAVILKNLATASKAQKVARRIFDSIAEPFNLSGNRISISVNIGVAPCDAEYETPEEVLRDADIAMHFAKEKESGVAVFTKDLRTRFMERVRYENDLRLALDREELGVRYQPLVDLHTGSLFGFEALMRWHHGEFGQIPPNKFIPIAEDSGQIVSMTRWMLNSACRQLAAWQAIGPEYAGLIMSVNISGKHLSNDDLLDDVQAAIVTAKIRPETLKLEITESAAMENAEHTIGMLHRLKSLGVQLSIDDFGTGYSSLSYLHRLPFDTLKIDRSFVYSVGEAGENSEILQTIISLAKNLKKKVIAEGIETEAQLTLLQNLGCDYGQGYLLSKPQTREKTERALYEHRRWLPSKDILIPIIQTDDTASLPVF